LFFLAKLLNFFVFFTATVVSNTTMAHWSYSGELGPKDWGKIAPAARGLHQSPINICPGDVRYEPWLAAHPLNISYSPSCAKTITNNGHSVQVSIDGHGSFIQGGPFPHKYCLEQFHFHWGGSDGVGSEHLIDGKHYTAELHLVHWNTELCSSFAEATKAAAGLAVLAVMLEVGPNEHKSFAKLTSLVSKVNYADESCPITDGFDPATLLPEDKTKYWTYSGSLTTPPCYESARFLIFKQTIQVSECQMNSLRKLHSDAKGHTGGHAGDHLVNNFRPVMPLNDRLVLCSFP